MKLDGTVAIVTGGASGIGAACMQALRDAGARPVAWDLADGEKVIACDVADPDAVAAAYARTCDEHDVPQVLVACAGIAGFGSVASMDLDAWRKILDVNLTGLMLCLRAFASGLIDAGLGGTAVTITSVNGQLADRRMGAYCASKAGADMLTRVAAAELGPHGIRVNAVAPGVTETPLQAVTKQLPGFDEQVRARTPLGNRIGTAPEVAEAVLSLLRADWVTGQVLAADGGLSLYSPIDPVGAMEAARD